MVGARFPAWVPALLALSACAAVPPSGPTVIALPPLGKDLGQFRQEDATCRSYAQQQLDAAQPADRQSATTVQLQQRYDIAYAQCMSASGNSVQPFAALWPYGPYGYPYPYPGFYGAWFGSAVALDTLSGFPHRFHRHLGFVRHGSRLR